MILFWVLLDDRLLWMSLKIAYKMLNWTTYGSQGFFHTWCNKRSNDDCISKKLDRVLVNDAWLGKYTNSVASFLPPIISDHSPSLVKLELQGRRKNCSFKFFNFLTEREDFLPLVESCWQEQVHGTMQFKLCSKFRILKKALKSLNKNRVGDVTIKLNEAKEALEECQRLLDAHPTDNTLILQEKDIINSYTMALQAEEDFLKQKSRIQWLQAGDRNSSYFFKAINGRQNRNKILSIMREDGSLIEGNVLVKNEAIRHFQKILGCSVPSLNRASTLQTIVHDHSSNDQADLISMGVTN
ncbi:hypothetical protein Dsin_029141 [Dipteronia sinensis]|uniref:Uncharacterized protein n=1 Tax=Dipteronia sinensis TaxID=43782 RepID=A0AAE0DV37_9ROSI|nr:hypothetical protein Dsin_029141 [Dipteronia sinensis]